MWPKTFNYFFAEEQRKITKFQADFESVEITGNKCHSNAHGKSYWLKTLAN
jgi:hypothetical protein